MFNVINYSCYFGYRSYEGLFWTLGQNPNKGLCITVFVWPKRRRENVTTLQKREKKILAYFVQKCKTKTAVKQK